MNLEQWNNLSDEEKNNEIAKSRGWYHTPLSDGEDYENLLDYGCWVNENAEIVWYAGTKYNPMGDMNLCMELVEEFPIYEITKYENGYDVLLRKIDDTIYWEEAPKLNIAICTAYAKAVGIITEE